MAKENDMKLLYIHDQAIDSGKANVIQVIHMCKAFYDNGIDVTLSVPLSNNTDVIKEIEKLFNEKVKFNLIPYNKITFFNRLNFIGGYLGVFRIIRSTVYDVYYTRNAAFLSLIVLNKLPVLYEAHQIDLHNKSILLNFLWKKILILITKSKYLLRFISISHALSSAWIKVGVPKEKVLVLHDGCDHNTIDITENKDKLKSELNIPSNNKIILYAGSLYKNRCIENILKLANMFLDKTFVIVGGPNDNKRHYEKLSAILQLNNVIFTGPVPHHMVKKYLYISDVLLMIWSSNVKTINYCSPLKMFEYMGAGRIIVGHSFPTITEVLEHGVTAFLSNPNSLLELKNNLSSALKQNYPNDMTDRASYLAMKYFTWNIRAKNIIKTIQYLN